MEKNPTGKKPFRENRGQLWHFLGFLAVFAGLIPYFYLGEGSIVSVRDQLDGEIVAYYLNAKYLFSGTGVFAEWMGGVPVTALVPPSPLTVFFYRLPGLFPAFFLNLALVNIAAYEGMYAFCRKLTGNAFLAACSAVLFSYLPFQTVYGLSVAGIPIAALAFLRLWDRGFRDGWSYLLIALYAGFSSPVLVGYAVVMVFGIGAVIGSARKKHVLWPAVMELVLAYGVLNFKLFWEVLFGMGAESHKTEYVHYGQSAQESFLTMLTSGNIAAPSLHSYIFWAVLAVLFMARVFWRYLSKQGKRDWKILCGFLGSAVLIAAFYALVQSAPAAQLRNRMDSALGSFQIDRFYWLYPALWYVMLALACGILWEAGNGGGAEGGFSGAEPERNLEGRAPWIACRAAALALIAVCGINVLQSSPFKPNLREMIRPEGSTSLAWRDYFAREEYAEIADFLQSEYGLAQGGYRVGSLGLEPAVSAVNGFFTIDGYSNNYPLAYKRVFQAVIARELEKNAYNRAYFEEWGNRCYLFSAEYYGNAFLSKYAHARFENLELDTEALKSIGCDYLLAAGEIAGAEERGYRLLKIFDSSEYLYVIYLYEIL